MKIKKLEDLNFKVTGNWYLRDNILYVEIKKSMPGSWGMSFTSFKYLSENRIFNMIGDSEWQIGQMN